MITQQKVAIYKKYLKDNDLFAIMADSTEKALMKGHWHLIDRFVQDLIMINNGLVSDQYIKMVETSLETNCENLETIHDLKAILH
jgi:hypothetical protein